MSKRAEDTAASTREQVLDELDELARVEHALCVEYLLIHCTLGHDVPQPAGAEPVLPQVSAAAQTAMSIAQNEMRHLRRVNGPLTLAGRPPQVGRASGIRGDSGAEIAFGLHGPAQLRGLLDREAAIASTVDARYARLRPLVDALDPVADGELQGQVSFIIDTCSDHSTPLAGLRSELDRLEPGQYLVVTRSEPATDLERTLLALSNGYYGVIVAMVEASFAHDEELGGRLLGRAVPTMEELNQIDRLLVERGLLPGFALPATTSGGTPARSYRA